MATQRKLTACALILILAVLGLMLIESAVAQQAVPSVPDFIVRLDDYSFTTAPTYTTDPYTGEQKIVSFGNYVSNKTIWITIKNQPFKPYKDKSGHEINLYYNITYKGHYETGWAKFPETLQNNTLEYTVIKIMQDPNVPKDGLMDFKVQTIAGYYNETVVDVKIDPYDYERYHLWLYYPGIASGNYTVSELVGEASGWTDVQTLSLSPTPADTVVDSISGFGLTRISVIELGALAIALVVVVSVVIVVLVRKFSK